MKTYQKTPERIGAMLKGWHNGYASVVDFRAMTSACEHDCFHCFTDKRKKDLKLSEILGVIDQIAEAEFTAINYLGEGEPTLDKDLFPIIEHTTKRGLVPVLFTDAATKLRDKDFVRRLFDLEATVCPKCDSLFNADYQNWVVGDKTGNYFEKRNQAIQVLIEQGFNKPVDGMTRLGFDMVVCKRNVQEVERTLRYCRDNNLWIVFSTFLPSGRSGKEKFNRSLMLTEEDLAQMRRQLSQIDKSYRFEHTIYNNFGTMPCVEFMQIYGDGRVSPCPGNETIIGNIRESSIKSLADKIRTEFPCHSFEKYTGHCPYRVLS